MKNNLRLYNSFGGKIREFKPIKPGHVSMYVCGITPYDTTHLGHAFTYMSFDALSRYLKFLEYKVNYVQNVTDIDDDILRRAARDGRDWQELGQFWTDKFLVDMKALNIELPTHYVKATESIPTIIKITSSLIKEGFAYQIDGAVYFNIRRYQRYGTLSQFSEKQMVLLSSERGGNPDDSNKRNPLDFILWVKSKKGEPSWPSPWSKGRPGWHIECSAMTADYLGNQIDIHGGGRDLIFPHHESEIAQSESYTGKSPFVKQWLHTGTVFYKGEKMAKSFGNLIMISDLLSRYSANDIRFCLLSHHYRTLWEFDEIEMQDCADEFRTLLSNCNSNTEPKPKSLDSDFLAALNNDFDTPRALELLLEKKPASLKSCLTLLGFVL